MNLENSIEQSIIKKLLIQIENHPQQLAIKTKTTSWSYEELNQAINVISTSIKAVSLQHSGQIVLLMESDATMIAAALASLATDNAYVSLEPDYPESRLLYMITDSKAHLILTDETHFHLATRLAKQCGITVLLLDNLFSDVSPVTISSNADSYAYIIYTSGTTGQPKGILQSHRNVLHFNRAYTNALQITPNDRISLLASFCFDAAIMDIFAALLNGASLYTFDLKNKTAEECLEWLHQEKITIYHSTPTVFRHLLQDTNSAHLLENLRVVILGGEKVELKDFNLYQTFCADTCVFINGYGPTESTVSAQYFMNKQTVFTTHSIPIGFPIENTDIFLLDADGSKTKNEGEIVIQSPYLALGYWNKLDLTKQFFHNTEKNRYYKTGDKGRLLTNGSIEFLGRLDDQVKIRGFRVELDEIIQAMLTYSGIQQALCLAIQENNNLQLAVYFVADKALPEDSLKKYLTKILPQYMLPALYFQLKSMPLTPNGKVDREALSALVQERNSQPTLPTTDIERQLTNLWNDLLSSKNISIHDNFFEIGGQSLIAMQMMSRIRREFSVDLPFRCLFESPTIAGLSSHIQLLKTEKTPHVFPLHRVDRKSSLLLASFAEQQFWLLTQLDPISPRYNLTLCMHLHGRLNLSTFKKAYLDLLHRHESLRTSFVFENDKLTRKIYDKPLSTLEIQSLYTPVDKENKKNVESIAKQFATYAFNLETGPLVKAKMLCLNETTHVFLISLAHIITDGWSLNIFANELSQLYNAATENKIATLNPLPIQYADYAAWQRSYLQGNLLESQSIFWAKELENFPDILSLTACYPRPDIASGIGEIFKFELDEKLCAQLQHFSEMHNVTLFMTLLTVFQILLHRHSQQEDILVGTPTANRNLPEVENIVGCFVNTIVLRGKPRHELTFLEFLQQIKTVTLNAFDNQDLPFEQVVELLKVPRHKNANPLFQVMFMLQTMQLQTLELKDIICKTTDIKTGTDLFDLSLFIELYNNRYVANFAYSLDLFSKKTIEHLAIDFQQLAVTYLNHPLHPIGFNPLSLKERDTLLVEWNKIEAEYPSDLCLHELFETQAKKTPDAIAVVFEGKQLSYYELNEKSNQLAHHLIKSGVGPEVLVAILLERSLELVISILGILKAGGAYVPLDPKNPLERLKWILEDTLAPILITQSTLAEQLKISHENLNHLQIIALDRSDKKIKKEANTNPKILVTSKNLAYVIYTSGSTGKPKGVLVEHFNVTRLLFSTQQFYQFNQNDVWTLFHSEAFDVSVWEMWGCLLNGGKLIVIPYFVSRSPNTFYQLLVQQEVTVLNQTPSAFQLLIDYEGTLEVLGNLRLRVVIFAGEALKFEMLAPWIQKHGLAHPRLVNMYGITETTIHSTYMHLTKKCLKEHKGNIIGKRVPDLAIYILDSQLNPVPIGIMGEIYIAGAGVARGYLNQKELTAQRFIENPYANEGDKKLGRNTSLYRSGDVARYLPNGNIEYCGRLDEQVKIRGFRIELGEIESILSKLTDIETCVVLAKDDVVQHQKRLIAYFIPRQKKLCSEDKIQLIEKLRLQSSLHLPDYMIPSAYVCLDTFPLTLNGKIDKNVFPNTNLDLRLVSIAHATPRTNTELLLKTIWSELLKITTIGIYDNFFSLGGHSLLAMQMLTRIRNKFHIELALKILFENPTIAMLSLQLNNHDHHKSTKYSTLDIKRHDRNHQSPLSFAQQRLWFMHQLATEQAIYNMPAAFYLKGKLDKTALIRALQAIVDRHEILRTRILLQANKDAYQSVLKHAHFEITQVDLSQESRQKRKQKLQKIIKAEARRKFDLSLGPLIRSQLITLALDEYVFLITMHHIVSDGWSLNIFMKELRECYQAYKNNITINLPVLNIQYADFSFWQKEWLKDDVIEKQLAYWKNHLQHAPDILQLPTDRARPKVETYHGAHTRSLISKIKIRNLEQLAEKKNSTLFMLLFAAFQVLMHRYTAQEQIVVGTPIANRHYPEVENLIGFFSNILAIKTECNNNNNFDVILENVRQTILEAYEHQDLPFEKLVSHLNVTRNLSHHPIFQVIFLVQYLKDQMCVELEGLESHNISVNHRLSKVDLEVTITEEKEGWYIDIEYATALFDKSTIQRLIAHYKKLLKEIVKDSSQPISQLDILSINEKQKLLTDWNKIETAYQSNLCLHEWFEAQVEKTPHAIAIIFEDKQLSYHELNEKSNQLAHHLTKSGVGPEVLVAILLERSLELVISILGILKAGGAYVPLDPKNPKARLKWILEDTLAPILITQSTLSEQLKISHEKLNHLQIIELDKYDIKIQKEASTNPKTLVTSDNLAYVIYTSGSTGRPKGVLVEHCNVTRLFSSTQQFYQFTQNDVWTLFHSEAFDVSVWEMWGCLLNGGKLIVIPYLISRSPEAFYQLLAQQEVTVLNQTPSAFNLLIDFESSLEVPGDLKLRLVIFAGEELEFDKLIPWVQKHGIAHPTLVNMYGITETTIHSTYMPITKKCLAEYKGSIIGKRIPDLTVYILDDQLNPAPIGIMGEIYIGGAGVTRGYLNRQDLTAERFIANPFVNETDKVLGRNLRLYRSGDLARFIQDGNIEYLGRADDQIKIRGFRIELGEVESKLNQHPDVKSCLVLAKNDLVQNQQRLVAYIISHQKNLSLEEQIQLIEQLKFHGSMHLPDYMIPSAYVFINEFTLTSNGKIDKKALPEPDKEQRVLNNAYDPARNVTEQTLVSIWSELLGITKIGIHDGFFCIGGNSLLVLKMSTLIQNKIGKYINVIDVFKNPTIAQISQLIDQKSEYKHPSLDNILRCRVKNTIQ